MQAAGQGHIGMLDSFTQIIAQNHYEGSEKLYAEELQTMDDNNAPTPLEFVCVFDPMDKLTPLDLKQKTEETSWGRDYVVRTGKYRTLKCCAHMVEKSKLEKCLEERRKEGMTVTSGLGAYILIKTLDVKAKTYPTIELIDDAEQHNTFVTKQKEHHKKLRQQLDLALTPHNNNVKMQGIPVYPLRGIIHSYLSTDLPHPKDESGCVIQ